MTDSSNSGDSTPEGSDQPGTDVPANYVRPGNAYGLGRGGIKAGRGGYGDGAGITRRSIWSRTAGDG